MLAIRFCFRYSNGARITCKETTMEQKFNAVAAAVQASGGKVTDLAKALGVSHQAVSLWLKDGRIPLSLQL
jgi:transposase-like protein